MTAAGRFAGGAGFAAALVFVLGGCGGGNKVSAISLEPRLLPASSVPGFNAVATRGVAKFGSASDAAKAQSWMHSQDVQQPCYGVCIFSPRVVKLAGVPGSKMVVQSQVRARPSDPSNYRAEFTTGRYLYWAWFSGDSRAKTTSQFERGIAAYYQHAKQQKS